MTTEAKEMKPPPLHDRVEIFEIIAETWEGGNDLELVQARFKGALAPFDGTAIPKNHDNLIVAISTYASTIELGEDADVLRTLGWIESEKSRHEPHEETNADRATTQLLADGTESHF